MYFGSQKRKLNHDGSLLICRQYWRLLASLKVGINGKGWEGEMIGQALFPISGFECLNVKLWLHEFWPHIASTRAAKTRSGFSRAFLPWTVSRAGRSQRIT